MTDWGREIIVDGKRPSWLTDDSSLRCRYASPSDYWTETTSFKLNWSGDSVAPVWAIRLPADHWAYRAINAGFEPWGGGDNAPDDWDADRSIMFATGAISTCAPHRWTHDSSPPVGGDIIGYCRRAEPTLRTADEALQRMEALVRRMAAEALAAGTDNESEAVSAVDYAEAREIAKLLPEPPVDPDEQEAIRICEESSYDITGVPEGRIHAVNTMIRQAVLVGIKRGRELAGR